MIEIYTLPDCKKCEVAKSCMKENNIHFVEYNLKAPENREARQKWRDIGLNTAPVIVCTNKEETVIFLEAIPSSLRKFC